MTTVFQKYSLRSMSTHAVRRFAQSMPFGHSASGLRSVSCVGVIADFASHRIGPSATTTRNTSSAACSSRRTPPEDAVAALVRRGDAPRLVLGTRLRRRAAPARGGGSAGCASWHALGRLDVAAHSDHRRVARK